MPSSGQKTESTTSLSMEEEKMMIERIPETDSIQELARFWDSHDLTDFEEDSP